MAGIVSFGAYVPYYRLPRSVINAAWGRGGGRGEKAVAGFDEDSVTMAVAAGFDSTQGVDPKTIDALYLASTTVPYEERLNATIVSTALDFRCDARNADFSNCLRAGAQALFSALDAVKAGSLGSVLVVAADCRLGAATTEIEQQVGDGAAAFLIGNDNVAVELVGSYTLSEGLADYWRVPGDKYLRAWEDRFGRDEGYAKIPVQAARGVMEKLNLTPKDFTKVCIYGTNMRALSTLARTLGFAPEQLQDPLLDNVGNTGTALPFMIFVSALEDAKPGDRILVLTWGNGCDAMVFQVNENIQKVRKGRGVKGHLAIRRELDNYGKYLRWRDMVPVSPGGGRPMGGVSMSAEWRERHTGLPLYGFKCRRCGTAQLFLTSSSMRAHVCLECQAKDEFDPYRFADKRGSVVSFSHDYLGGGIDPPATRTVVDFEGGGRGFFDMVDRDPEECKVGMKVEMTFRKVHGGVTPSYFWKCKPVRD